MDIIFIQHLHLILKLLSGWGILRSANNVRPSLRKRIINPHRLHQEHLFLSISPKLINPTVETLKFNLYPTINFASNMKLGRCTLEIWWVPSSMDKAKCNGQKEASTKVLGIMTRQVGRGYSSRMEQSISVFLRIINS